MPKLSEGSSIKDADAHEGDFELHHSCIVQETNERVPILEGQIIHVCFPVVVPGESGRVIPFGRYGLAVSHQNKTLNTTLEEVALINLDTGMQVVLSAPELTAIALDPDVDII